MKNTTELIRQTFNVFNGRNLQVLDSFYAPEIHFVDPVTEIHGLESLKKYYAHAFQNVKNIRFEFDEFIEEDAKVGASWKMHLSARGLNGGREFTVPGFSHFHFNSDQLAIYHRDYLDLGAMVYEKIPVQGPIIQVIKKLLQGTSRASKNS